MIDRGAHDGDAFERAEPRRPVVGGRSTATRIAFAALADARAASASTHPAGSESATGRTSEGVRRAVDGAAHRADQSAPRAGLRVLFANDGSDAPGPSRVATLDQPAACARLAGVLVIAPRRQVLEAWLGPDSTAHVLGLDELAGFLAPGGLGSDFERLLAQRAGARSERGGADLDAAGPVELERATRALVESLHALALPELAAIGRAWEEAAARLELEAPAAARRLALLGRLVDRPSSWAGAGESVFEPVFGAGEALADGRIAAARSDYGDLDMALAEAVPGWSADAQRSRATEDAGPLPPDHDGVAPLDEADLERVHRALAEHLPALGGGRVARGRPLAARSAQVDVGDRIARSFGRREHLLLHAPTGTGKTLAYLVPALLFAVRNGLRVGLSTYTKALQRQAFDRDLPIALELLARIGIDPLPRVCVLKGRSNYVCWRALVSLAPSPSDRAARHLAFCHLLAFALTSSDGDIDRLTRTGLAPFADVPGLEEEWELLRRSLGARSGCCSRPGDRSRCGADAARKRAERSHGVVTNHAFALARPEFFRHVVFDECEHLHDQAHAAFSRAVHLDRARRLLDDLGGARGRSALESLRRAIDGALAFGAARTELERAFAARTRARAAVERLARGARHFWAFRREQSASRDRGGEHALLREYVEQGLGRGDAHVEQLVASHAELCRALQELSTALRALSEGLFEIPVPRRERVRFELDGSQSDVDELLEAVAPWLPLRDGAPAYDAGTFYDLDERPSGDVALETRVLLPHEYLGRFHYPKLAGAICLSATTLLRGGFEDARRYLGLERAASPAPDEERTAEHVATHAAPESFDYSRVCVLAPSDVPDYRSDKRGWQVHGARLVAHLATRTHGRLLALYTNQDDLNVVARLVRPHLERLGIEVLAQNSGTSSERLAERFRTHGRAVLLGVDSFWFGADFPGEALEYLVLAKLPYGVPDRYHHAQCAALGTSEQRRTIYVPRALARFRQGFGRLMRRADDRGCVFVLDRRLTEPQHRVFLRELPLAGAAPARTANEFGEAALGPESDATEVGAGRRGARLVRGDSDHCLRAAFEHMGLAPGDAPSDLYAPLAATELD